MDDGLPLIELIQDDGGGNYQNINNHQQQDSILQILDEDQYEWIIKQFAPFELDDFVNFVLMEEYQQGETTNVSTGELSIGNDLPAEIGSAIGQTTLSEDNGNSQKPLSEKFLELDPPNTSQTLIDQRLRMQRYVLDKDKTNIPKSEHDCYETYDWMCKLNVIENRFNIKQAKNDSIYDRFPNDSYEDEKMNRAFLEEKKQFLEQWNRHVSRRINLDYEFQNQQNRKEQKTEMRKKNEKNKPHPRPKENETNTKTLDINDCFAKKNLKTKNKKSQIKKRVNKIVTMEKIKSPKQPDHSSIMIINQVANEEKVPKKRRNASKIKKQSRTKKISFKRDYDECLPESLNRQGKSLLKMLVSKHKSELREKKKKSNNYKIVTATNNKKMLTSEKESSEDENNDCSTPASLSSGSLISNSSGYYSSSSGLIVPYRIDQDSNNEKPINKKEKFLSMENYLDYVVKECRLSYKQCLSNQNNRMKMKKLKENIQSLVTMELIKKRPILMYYHTWITCYFDQNFEETIKLCKSIQFPVKLYRPMQLLWEHSIEKLELKKKGVREFTSVQRFRLKQRNKYPPTIWDGNRVKYGMSVENKNYLIWFYENFTKNPNQRQKEFLANLINSNVKHVATFFKNRRSRTK